MSYNEAREIIALRNEVARVEELLDAENLEAGRIAYLKSKAEERRKALQDYVIALAVKEAVKEAENTICRQ